VVVSIRVHNVSQRGRVPQCAGCVQGALLFA